MFEVLNERVEDNLTYSAILVTMHIKITLKTIFCSIELCFFRIHVIVFDEANALRKLGRFICEMTREQ